MSIRYTAELFVRLSAKRADGTRVYMDHVLDPDFAWSQVWEAAHGAPGDPDPFSLGAALWSEAARLRATEKRLFELPGRVMKRNVGVTVLVNLARIRAAEQLGALEATQENLDKLATEVRNQIILQATTGMWAEWKVKVAEDLEGLVVQARRGRKLLGEPSIVLEYNFRHTALPSLIVKTEGVKRGRA